MVEKWSDAKRALSGLRSGMTIMIGGFLGVGTPESLIDAVIDNGAGNLTIIGNDTSFPDRGIGRLIANDRVSRVITSHIGTNPLTGDKMHRGDLEVVLTPQGTLAEQVRAAGAGLGAVVTPTGVGTRVAEGKEQLVIDGKSYLVEKPLRADIALIRAAVVDYRGNAVYHQAAQNFNPLMAMAADYVIVEAAEYWAERALDPNHIHTPHIFIDAIVGEVNHG